ncbi:EAL domain-containing protein [Kluyvera genomosp. 1]|uniref:sensor domain-containing phosphodiesterase n=1 Tax=Kluyvera genomosp. 1 TaxID=2774053 RepID=UPI00068FBA74|nr:EAL domain-containing protein [Kluyvera genomosp. 1]
MTVKWSTSVRKFFLVLIMSLVAIPFSRYISPTTFYEGHSVYLAWLPLGVMIALVMLFGRHAVLPLIVGFTATNYWQLNLSPFNSLILLFCQLTAVCISSLILRSILGRRWRHGLAINNLGLHVFWLGFAAPILAKIMMYMVGELTVIPPSMFSYFNITTKIYTIVDIQGLVCASLIFTKLFYYPFRMCLNPNYARAFWRRNFGIYRDLRCRLNVCAWFLGLAVLLFFLCMPFDEDYFAGYLVPMIFIFFSFGISQLTYPVVIMAWTISAFMLVMNNTNFLHGIQTQYSLSFVLSSLISFTVCLLYMLQIYHRSKRVRQKWQEQAMIDPLTGLPNLRALEDYLEKPGLANVCCLHIENLDFLSRHYGMMMRIQCKRSITQVLQPVLGPDEKMFQLPGNELLLVLYGPDTAARLHHLIAFLRSQEIRWNNSLLNLEYGISWGRVRAQDGNLYHTLGQLSWLAEQAGEGGQILKLDNGQVEAFDQTSEQVVLLNRIKNALDGDGFVLYAQPIRKPSGEGYYEILSRLVDANGMVTPDKFIPVLTQFNLSKRFDMQVLEKLFGSLEAFPGQRFSVNLMPYTLMQKESAAEIIALFRRYRVNVKRIVVEITEEQAFSNSDVSIKNLNRLREFGCQIAIDDFGTGYANYERLKRVEADIIKIDGSFVRDVLTDPMDAMIIRSICELAKVQNLEVVAEFVETEAQQALLVELGVHYMQGYLIDKPRPLCEIGYHTEA